MYKPVLILRMLSYRYFYIYIPIKSRRSEDDEDYELSDRDINKILIVTQTGPPMSSRIPKHEGHDRTGDRITRVKMTQELELVISDGLYYYEEDLWLQDRQTVRLQFYVRN